MPGYVYNFRMNGAPSQAKFNDWVDPKEAKLTSIAIRPVLGKIVLVHCYPDNSHTDVYEWDVGYRAATKTDLANRLEDYVDEMTDDNHTAELVNGSQPHIAQIGGGKEPVIGLLIGHSAERELVQPAPLIIPVRRIMLSMN